MSASIRACLRLNIFFLMKIDRRPTPTNADRTTQAKGVSRFAGKKYQPQTHTEAHRPKDVKPLRGENIGTRMNTDYTDI